MADYLIRCSQCQVVTEAVREQGTLLGGGDERILPPKGWLGAVIFPGTQFAMLVTHGSFCSYDCLRAWASEQERLAARQADAAARE